MKKLKNAVRCISLALILALALPSLAPGLLTPPVVEAASVKLSKTKLTLTVGKTYRLSVKGTRAKVSWNSGNKKVATVSNGLVKAKKAGSATITAKAGKKKLTCKVTVKENYKALYRAMLAKGKVTYNDGYGNYTTTAKGFCLLDVDKNGVPELIVNNMDSSAFSTKFVYTVKNGKVIYCGSYSTRGETTVQYSSKHKALYNSWWTNGVGGSGSMLYRISGSKLKEYKYAWTGSVSYGSSKRVYYYGNSQQSRKKVSKSKFNSMVKTYFKSVKKYSFVKNNAANRKKKLG